MRKIGTLPVLFACHYFIWLEHNPDYCIYGKEVRSNPVPCRSTFSTPQFSHELQHTTIYAGWWSSWLSSSRSSQMYGLQTGDRRTDTSMHL